MTGYGGLDGIRFETVPLKRVLKGNDGGAWGADSEAPGTTPVAVLRSTDQSADGNWALESPATRFLTAVEARATRLIEGDLVVTKSSGSERHIGKTTIVDSGVASLSPGFSNFMQRLRPNPRVTFPRFAWYFLNSQVAREQMVLASSTSTGLANLNAQVIGDLLIPLPSLEKQCRIAAFLDHETARIDELVHEQERLLFLLEERDAARITDLMTNGLSDDVERRDSGYEELGTIPAHWGVARLKHLLRAPLTYGANEAAGEDDPTLPRYIRISDLDDQGGLRDETFRSLPWKVAAPYLLEDRDLLLARSGTVGKSFLYRKNLGPACFAGYMIRARFDQRKVIPEFTEAYFRSRPYWNYVHGSSIQATIQNVSAEKYGNCPIPVPPMKEQVAILEKLTAELKASGELLSQAEVSINYLLERRVALIGAAVTGQLDLRGWQPPEPEAVAEVA